MYIKEKLIFIIKSDNNMYIKEKLIFIIKSDNMHIKK